MKRINKLITQVRRQTENDNEAAISNDEVLSYFNDGIERLHAVITAKHPRVFSGTVEIPIVRGQSAYDLPIDAFINNKVVTVEFSYTGREEDYYPLEPITLKERIPYDGYPTRYFRKDGKVILDPTPDTAGLIRIEYVLQARRVDTRRAVVQTVTITDGVISDLILSNTDPIIELDSEAIEVAEYVCVVDKYGNIKAKNLPVNSLDTGTGELVLESGFVLQQNETINSEDFIVVGEYTSTHPLFPRNCERYLTAYVSWKLLKRDSSADFAEQQQELLTMEQDIVNSYADIDDDYARIPVYNSFSLWD